MRKFHAVTAETDIAQVRFEIGSRNAEIRQRVCPDLIVKRL